MDKALEEKNKVEKQEITKFAQRFQKMRKNYRWLEQLLAQNQLDPDQGILIFATLLVDRGESDNYMGCWLTIEKQFYQFEVVVDTPTHELIESKQFENITEQTHIAEDDPVVGKSFGALALEVLAETRP